ncbi:MAG: hypothetical protein JJE03_00850 [Peptostreptococcaceae bacterium]|nr:hypothetical protein [Peptostreptococcaceae bacterium]
MMRTKQKLKENTKESKYYIVFVITILFVGYALSGPSSVRSNYISFFLFLVWCFVASITDSMALIKILNKKIILVFLMYEIFFFFTTLLSLDFHYTIKLFFESFILFSPIIIFQYFIGINQNKLLKKLLYVSGSFWIFFTLRAIIFLNQNPSAARILASNQNAYENALIGGGYSLAYGSAILGIYIFDLAINKSISNKKNRRFSLVIVLIFAVFIIKVQSTITIIAFFIGIVASLILSKLDLVKLNKSKKILLKRISVIICLIIFSFIFVINYTNIGLFIINQTSDQDSALKIRAIEIGEKMAYGEEANYMDARINIPLKSLKVFLKNPLVGIGYLTGYDYLIEKQLGLGNHGEWADALGTMGLLGGIPYLLIYIYGVKIERKYSKQRVSPAWIITLVLMGLFNPFKTFQSHFALFFMISAIGYLMSNREN